MKRLRFSQRIGKEPVPATVIQTDTMDDPLRNAVWSALHVMIFEDVHERLGRRPYYWQPEGDPVDDYDFHEFFLRIWDRFLEEPVDTIPSLGKEAVEHIRKRFFSADPMDAYNLLDVIIEVVHEISAPMPSAREFDLELNRVLERESCGYRVVAGQLAPITNEMELAEISAAAATPDKDPFTGAREHLATALRFYADRDTPDYRNSVKESISAVESVLKVLTGKPGIDLGPALSELEKKGVGLHGGLRKGVAAIYGYTSDEGGIRHAMVDDAKCDGDDARYMLVICSALVNFLIAKGARARLP